MTQSGRCRPGVLLKAPFCVTHQHPRGSRHDYDGTGALPVGEFRGGRNPRSRMSRQLAWLLSHPAAEPHFVRFQNQASELGDRV